MLLEETLGNIIQKEVRGVVMH